MRCLKLLLIIPFTSYVLHTSTARAWTASPVEDLPSGGNSVSARDSISTWNSIAAANSISAQNPIREDLLKRCRSCRLTLVGQESVQGMLTDIQTATLELEIEERKFDKDPFQPSVDLTYRRAIPFDSISSMRCGDGVINGTILGALIGGLPTWLIVSAATSGDGVADPREANGSGDRSRTIALSVLAGTTVGAIVGYLIDNASGKRGEVDIETLQRAGRVEIPAPHAPPYTPPLRLPGSIGE